MDFILTLSRCLGLDLSVLCIDDTTSLISSAGCADVLGMPRKVSYILHAGSSRYLVVYRAFYSAPCRSYIDIIQI